MSDRQECNSCRYYVAVSSRIVVRGVPVKTCSYGEMPETCKRKGKK